MPWNFQQRALDITHQPLVQRLALDLSLPQLA